MAVILEAHRGVSAYYPENTLSAYAAAKALGYGMIELDNKFTADNRCVCLHDRTLNRTARYADGSKLAEELLTNPAAPYRPVCFIDADGTEVSAIGKCEGIITREARGEGGFGYDPLFFFPSFGKTFGELTAEEKNEVSHRANAVKILKEKLCEYFSKK